MSIEMHVGRDTN